MDISLIPAKPGQICKVVSDIPDKESDLVYIVAEDPAGFDGDEEIEVVELKELQRNIKTRMQPRENWLAKTSWWSSVKTSKATSAPGMNNDLKTD